MIGTPTGPFNPDAKAVYYEAQSKIGYVHRQKFAAPLAAAAATIHALVNSALVITTGITQPDMARVLSIVSGGSGHNAAGVVVINGTDYRGNTIADTITLNGNTTVNGIKAFASVTSIDMTGVTGNDANNTVSVGISKILGLHRILQGDEVLCVTVDGVWETTRPTVVSNTTDISQNTLSPNTAPNAAKNFTASYITTEIF